MEQPQLIAAAMEFAPPDLLIERFAQSHKVPHAEARELFNEMKKFLCIAASFPDMRFAPNKKIDEMWHDFVLFTPDYHRFCKIFGRYIHHVPSGPHPDSVKQTNYSNTLEKLRVVFGNPDPKYWFLPDSDDECSGCWGTDCDGRGCEIKSCSTGNLQ